MTEKNSRRRPPLDLSDSPAAAGAWFSPPVMMASAAHSKAYRERLRSGALACKVDVSLSCREWLIETGRLAEASGNEPAKVAAAIKRLLQNISSPRDESVPGPGVSKPSK
ncbi:hypothetical protein EN850_20815 [Mesorhizobium sp. M8A.F.Ca.ET.207.01.1.1]|uniref:hypothetical protein n=1 Tax=Mesorhizobium sp. M8A.F.Ca.ET.207.01.1.1 TaxID=2563968 RepID=UPI00109CA849|nr:hypothetical protein [Mesorhizobium sp. M8A.F.Ca.ET.207.01.1.1]TGQ79333.1 hypothetical protein EN850_20815 [Mesorhizobium sp. M8A.F.Ca.ET.207.01.1.1]